MDNRLIKFRGKVNGVWWYATPDNPWWSSFWEQVDRETVGQYVGVNDERKREIYTDDILGLRDPSDHSRALIVFRNAAFHAELVGAPYIDDPHWTTIDSNWVVIGNRFENPELLDGKAQR